MNYRSFGMTGLQVSEIGLGCSHLGTDVFSKSEKESVRVLHRAFEAGINFYDTADIYGYGGSEKLIGCAFKGRRDKVIISSKVGRVQSLSERTGRFLLPILQPIRHVQPLKGILKKALKPGKNFASDHLKKAVEKSLKRLQTDYLDLYQLHSPSSWVIEQGEVFNTLDYFKREGKIRFYGVSVETLNDAFLCLKYSDISSLQITLNLLEHEAVKKLLPQAGQRKVAIIARIPLARGLLTEKNYNHTDLFTNKSRLQTSKSKVEKLSFLVNGGFRTLPQAALQFVLHHSQVSVVIPGTRTLKHLEENLETLKAPYLTKDELEKIALL